MNTIFLNREGEYDFTYGVRRWFYNSEAGYN